MTAVIGIRRVYMAQGLLIPQKRNEIKFLPSETSTFQAEG